MKATACWNGSEWLKTEDPVVAVNKAIDSECPALRSALKKGVCAIADRGRSGFYDVEIDGRCYFIHIPERLSRVYVIASFLLLRERAVR